MSFGRKRDGFNLCSSLILMVGKIEMSRIAFDRSEDGIYC